MSVIVASHILILYYHSGSLRSVRAAIRHHLLALESVQPQERLIYFNAIHGAPAWLRHLQFRTIVLHTTFLCMRWSRSFSRWKRGLDWIGKLDCTKIALPQDEYDHSNVLDEWLDDWAVSVIFTNFGPEYRQQLYPRMRRKAEFYECYTGYIDEAAAHSYAFKLKPPAARPNIIVYRATHLPYWFGSHGQLKHRIAAVVEERARALGLTCDISTRPQDLILGDRWLDFLASSRAVIGCESGSSVLDRRGELQAQVRALLKGNPSLTFEQVGAYMPAGWDDYRFLAISPRHFEAVITKTCQILVEGHYNSVLEPDRHYIPLKRDFSNLDEVLAKVQDDGLVTKMVECAYNEIYLSGQYTYRRLAAELVAAIVADKSNGVASKRRVSRALWTAGELVASAAAELAAARAWVGAKLIRPLRARLYSGNK